MSEFNTIPSHTHLSAEAIWDWAEFIGVSPDAASNRSIPMPTGYSTEARLKAEGCPICGPALKTARQQWEGLRSLPEIKAPPDFLALVQKRLAQEPSGFRKLWATLFPGRRSQVGLPVGLASALLLVVVLVVVMPNSPLRGLSEPALVPQSIPEEPIQSFPKPIAQPKSQPSRPQEMLDQKSAEMQAPESPKPAKEKSVSRQLSKTTFKDAETDDRESREPMPSRKKTERKAAMESEGSLASDEMDSPIPSQAPASPKPLPAPTNPASEAFISSQPIQAPDVEALAESKPESKASHDLVIGNASGVAAGGEPTQVHSNADFGEMAKKGRMKPMVSPQKNKAEEGEENERDTLPDFKKVRSGDTLWIMGRKSETERLKLWLNQKQWMTRAEIFDVGDSVKARIRP